MRLGAGFLAIVGASCHMIMQHPVPFGKDTLNNSPLVDAKPGSSQSDYPCKKRAGVYKIDEMNKMAVGQQVELNFTGSASHGGGTCQISVTLDPEPDVNSDFKVIQTFEGGCPTAQDGNSGSTDFFFQIPKGFPNGRATLAWTWFNKIGNREIYMNCAPIEVSGGSDSKDVYNALPNMYLINLPTTECKSADSEDVLVPFPGDSVKKASTAKLAPPTGPGCAAAAKKSKPNAAAAAAPNAGGSSAPPAKGTDQAASCSSAAPATSSAPASSAPSGMKTVTTIASAPSAAPSESAAPSAPASESTFPTMSVSSGAGVSGPASTGASAAMPPSGTGSASSGSGSGSGSGTCSSDGEVVCNGTSQFGLCNSGKVVWQSVASGTQCVNGKITKRSTSGRHHRRHAGKHS